MLPSYEVFLAPTLLALEHAVEPDAVAERVADALGLDETARAEIIAYDGEPAYVARTRMALKALGHAGLVKVAGRDLDLTQAGRAALPTPPTSAEQLERYPEYSAYRARHLARRGA